MDQTITKDVEAARSDEEPDAMGPVRTSELGAPQPTPSHSQPKAVHPDQASAALIAQAGLGERYQSRRMLGRGGMGEVRLCKDQWIGREIAMKVMRTEHQKRDDLRVRFLSEAQVQGQLEHPAIVPVYDLGVLPDGNIYFSMKRLRGQTLAEILDSLREGNLEAQEKYPRHRLLGAFASLCLALDFAHTRGVLHRDLKPANIMLGDFGEVYLLDWGLAKLREPTKLSPAAQSASEVGQKAAPEPQIAIENPMETAAGHLIGTLGYMAPEQAAEVDAPVDGRADIFSLGAVLFEILTLQRLRPPMSTDQLLLSIKKGLESRPTVRAPEREIPPELDEICVRATQQQPSERFATARELHDEIQRFLAGDRDLDLRRQLAAHYMGAAANAAKDALSGGSSERRQRALQDLGRVLALDPSHAEALALLYQLITKPPSETPPEIEKTLQEVERERERVPLRMANRIGLVLAAILALMLWTGVRNWLLFGIACVCAPILITVRALQLREHQMSRALRLAALVMHLGMYAILSRLFGPLVFVTLPMAMYSVIHSSTADHRYRNLVVVSNAILLLLLVGLEALHIVPPSYIFRDGTMIIVPHLANLTEGASLAMLTVVSLTSIMLPALTLGQLPQRAHELQKQNLLQNWQLSHLIPK
jgi:serine/threonine protein kinase